MALKQTVKTVHGFDAVDAYHRIEQVQINPKDEIHFAVRVYKDNSDLPAFDSKSYFCAYDMDGANPIAQAYIYLKTLQEFADAQDC